MVFCKGTTDDAGCFWTLEASSTLKQCRLVIRIGNFTRQGRYFSRLIQSAHVDDERWVRSGMEVLSDTRLLSSQRLTGETNEEMMERYKKEKSWKAGNIEISVSHSENFTLHVSHAQCDHDADSKNYYTAFFADVLDMSQGSPFSTLAGEPQLYAMNSGGQQQHWRLGGVKRMDSLDRSRKVCSKVEIPNDCLAKLPDGDILFRCNLHLINGINLEDLCAIAAHSAKARTMSSEPRAFFASADWSQMLDITVDSEHFLVPRFLAQDRIPYIAHAMSSRMLEASAHTFQLQTDAVTANAFRWILAMTVDPVNGLREFERLQNLREMVDVLVASDFLACGWCIDRIQHMIMTSLETKVDFRAAITFLQQDGFSFLAAPTFNTRCTQIVARHILAVLFRRWEQSKDLLLQSPVTGLDSLWDLARQSGADELLTLLPEPKADAVVASIGSGAGAVGQKRTREDCEDDLDGTTVKARCS